MITIIRFIPGYLKDAAKCSVYDKLSEYDKSTISMLTESAIRCITNPNCKQLYPEVVNGHINTYGVVEKLTFEGDIASTDDTYDNSVYTISYETVNTRSDDNHFNDNVTYVNVVCERGSGGMFTTGNKQHLNALAGWLFDNMVKRLGEEATYYSNGFADYWLGRLGK